MKRAHKPRMVPTLEGRMTVRRKVRSKPNPNPDLDPDSLSSGWLELLGKLHEE